MLGWYVLYYQFVRQHNKLVLQYVSKHFMTSSFKVGLIFCCSVTPRRWLSDAAKRNSFNTRYELYFILSSTFVSGSAYCKNMHGMGNIKTVATCRVILPQSIFGSEINGVNVAPTSNFRASAMLFIPIAGNIKYGVWVSTSGISFILGFVEITIFLLFKDEE